MRLQHRFLITSTIQETSLNASGLQFRSEASYFRVLALKEWILWVLKETENRTIDNAVQVLGWVEKSNLAGADKKDLT